MKAARPGRSFGASILDPIIERIAARLEANFAQRTALLFEEIERRIKALTPPPAAEKPEDREYVRWAYRLLLNREPEFDDAYLSNYPSASDHARLVSEFLKSAEFRSRTDLQIGSPGLPDPPPYLLRELENGARFWINLRDEGVSRCILQGAYENDETAFVRRHVKSGMNALDIGANLGWFTVEMGRLAGPAGRVVAFEPRSDIYHYLCKTVRDNGLANVIVHNCALGSETTEADLCWPKGDPCSAWSQLVPHQLDRDQFEFAKVSMRVLDEILDERRVDFIKIDVEGAEKLVFDGGRRVLTKDRPLILSEVSWYDLAGVSQISPEEYVNYLGSSGYIPRLIGPEGTLGATIEQGSFEWREGMIVNVAFVPSEMEAG